MDDTIVEVLNTRVIFWKHDFEHFLLVNSILESRDFHLTRLLSECMGHFLENISNFCAVSLVPTVVWFFLNDMFKSGRNSFDGRGCKEEGHVDGIPGYSEQFRMCKWNFDVAFQG